MSATVGIHGGEIVSPEIGPLIHLWVYGTRTVLGGQRRVGMGNVPVVST
ncbi:hypothetical protein [Kineosporia sp. NBRC 101731]|nr:hypothetical protein [Kineosporia sp. NBRC 101731]